MLQKIVTYGVIAVGATSLMYAAATAQAIAGHHVTRGHCKCAQASFNHTDGDQVNEVSNRHYACDVHLPRSRPMDTNNENRKCAQASFKHS